MDFIELSAEEAMSLLNALHSTATDSMSPGLRKLRVAVEGDRVKFKINEHTWSPPLGKKGEPY